LTIHDSRWFQWGKARDEPSPVRAKRAWFLFRGERSPNRERDSSLVNRTGDESLALPLIRLLGAQAASGSL
jgi:hypothetical protein